MPHVGAPPRCEPGLPATPPPPADIRTRGGCSYGGFGLLRYVLCRSTAPVRTGFAGNSAAAGWHSHPRRVLLRWVRASPICSVSEHRPRCETGLPTTPPPAGIRTRGGCSYSGFGLLRYVMCRSTAPVRNGAAGSSAPLLCGRASARPYQARSAGALQEVTWLADPGATCAHASCACHWPPASPETPQYLPPP